MTSALKREAMPGPRNGEPGRRPPGGGGDRDWSMRCMTVYRIVRQEKGYPTPRGDQKVATPKAILLHGVSCSGSSRKEYVTLTPLAQLGSANFRKSDCHRWREFAPLGGFRNRRPHQAEEVTARDYPLGVIPPMPTDG